MTDLSVRAYAKFADTIFSMAQRAVPEKIICELGTIVVGWGLTIDTFLESDGKTPIIIPLGEWSCLDYLTLPFDAMSLTPDGLTSYIDFDTTEVIPDIEGHHGHLGTGGHGHGDPQGGSTGSSTITIPDDGGDAVSGAHSHTVMTPLALRPLMPDDRVLVTWIANIPIVTGRLRNSRVFLEYTL